MGGGVDEPCSSVFCFILAQLIPGQCAGPLSVREFAFAFRYQGLFFFGCQSMLVYGCVYGVAQVGSVHLGHAGETPGGRTVYCM